MKIKVERGQYTAQTTTGKMYLDGVFFGFTLEDTVRPANVKVYGHTAIPAGVYKVAPYERPSGQKTIIIYTEADGVTLKAGWLTWTYVLAHGGNTHLDTDGCVLVAKNKIDADRIQGSLMNELRARCDEAWKAGEEIEIEFVNLTQRK